MHIQLTINALHDALNSDNLENYFKFDHFWGIKK